MKLHYVIDNENILGLKYKKTGRIINLGKKVREECVETI